MNIVISSGEGDPAAAASNPAVAASAAEGGATAGPAQSAL